MQYNIQSNLKRFVVLENKIRNLYRIIYEDHLHIKNWYDRTEITSEKWRMNKNVREILSKLKQISSQINKNFLALTLSDFLKLVYFFIGYHEELYNKIDDSHRLISLIKKPKGYSFASTASYLLNRLEEVNSEKEVQKNNQRIEMCIFYISIFISRLLYSPYLRNQQKNSQTRFNLDLTISELKIYNMSHNQIKKEKTQFLLVLEGVLKDNNHRNITQGDYDKIISLAIQNFINMLSIGIHLKQEIYNEEWKIIRPSFFETCEAGWTTKTYMCRIYEGPVTNSEFPFESILPEVTLLLDNNEI